MFYYVRERGVQSIKEYCGIRRLKFNVHNQVLYVKFTLKHYILHFSSPSQTWYAKTPLGKKRAKAAQGDDEDDGKGKKGKKGGKKGKKGKKKK